VVNATCHRDYFEKGSRVMVEVFDDRVDVVSPGGVCKGITRENFGTVTITRNPIIASMFFRIDYIEQMGTGIGRMRDATRKANVAEPVFEFDGFFKVTFKRNPPDTSIGRQSAANRPPIGRYRSRRLPESKLSLLILKNMVKLKFQNLLISSNLVTAESEPCCGRWSAKE
jgi:ATP-dependent DNA helicase RecG